jgi:hypothetical protein
MKSDMKKMVYLALVLTFLGASRACAAPIDTAKISVPAWEWEARFVTIAGKMKIVGANPSFTFTELADRAPAARFEHKLDLNSFINVTYYDDGKDAFNSAILTINLDGVRRDTRTVWLAVTAVTMAGDPQATDKQVVELINAICPMFDDVLTGKERLSGARTRTLHGIGYRMELNDDERYARFVTNAELTQNDPSGDNVTADAEYYTLGNDRITSITKVVGQRNVVRSGAIRDSGVTTMTVVYSTDPADPTQAGNDVAKYFQYLLDNDDFLALKSFEDLPYEGGVEMSFGKDSVDNGQIIILDIDYDVKGYTLKFQKGEGKLTRH